MDATLTLGMPLRVPRPASGPALLLGPDPVTGEMGVITGDGPVADARTSTIYPQDFEGVWRAFKTTIPSYAQARVVTNHALRTEDFSQAVWTKSNITLTSGIDDPDGGTSATTLTSTATNGIMFQDSLGETHDAADEFRNSLWARRRTGTGSVMMRAPNNTDVDITSVLTTSWKRFASGVTIPSDASTAFSALKVAVSGDEVDMAFPQMEKVSGQANQNPGEYVANTTSAASTSRTYGTANGNSVASNVVTEAVGTPFATVPRLHSGPAMTNEIPQSSDLTDLAWTETGSSVSALDAVGMRGEANGATTLTDNDGAALEYVHELVAIPDDSNTHVARVFIAKDTDETRFPEVNLGLENGTAQALGLGVNTETGATADRISTGTNASEVIDRGDWWEVLVSVTNNGTGNTEAQLFIFPAMGTTIGVLNVAATGSIVVGNTELHLAKEISDVRGTSPIFNSGAPGSIVVSAASVPLTNHTAGQGGYFVKWTPQYATAEVSGNIEILSLNGGADLLFYDATNSLLKSTDGTNTASVALTIVADTEYSVWVAYGGTSLQVGVDATTGTEGTYDGAFAEGSKIDLNRNSLNVNELEALQHWDTPFAATVATFQDLAS